MGKRAEYAETVAFVFCLMPCGWVSRINRQSAARRSCHMDTQNCTAITGRFLHWAETTGEWMPRTLFYWLIFATKRWLRIVYTQLYFVQRQHTKNKKNNKEKSTNKQISKQRKPSNQTYFTVISHKALAVLDRNIGLNRARIVLIAYGIKGGARNVSILAQQSACGLFCLPAISHHRQKLQQQQRNMHTEIYGRNGWLNRRGAHWHVLIGCEWSSERKLTSYS